MGSSTGKCESCKEIFPVVKEKPEDNYSDVVKEMKCPKCGSEDIHMVFGLNYDVCIGMCGNAKSGYSSSVTYHPSQLGRFSGKKVSK